MAHLILALRGRKEHINRWIEDWQANYWRHDVPNTDLIHGDKKVVEDAIKNKTPTYLQTIVRPVQLVEVVVPQNAVDSFLKTTFNNNKKMNGHIFSGPKMNVLRRGLGLKKMPECNENSGIRLIAPDAKVSIYPIGYKEDKILPDGQEYL